MWGRRHTAQELVAAVRAGIIDRTGGGVLLPEDPDTKTGRPVIDVLREKHRVLMIPDLEGEEA